MVRRRVRIRFRKEGDLRCIAHLDLVRAWERLLRRAEIPLVMSEGFHSRPHITFPSALPILEAAQDEVVEIDTDSGQSLDALRQAIDRCSPAGLSTTAIEELSPTRRASQVREVAYAFPISPQIEDEVQERVDALLESRQMLVERKGRPPVNLRDLLLEACIEQGVLRFRLRVTREVSLRARDVLAALLLETVREQGACLTRTRVELDA